MKHLGDISKINGAEIEPVDIITFGSPCQDLSLAGKRVGLKGVRSGLFMEAVRIIKEMREATDGKYPRFALWENVPGAFSSNKGEDFRVVLEELIKIAEPGAVMPAVPPFGWAYADSYVGDGWSLAYRVFDTQYWPRTPQRRRRIYLVADFGGQCARKVLFEREGLRRYLTESRASWQRTAADAENGIGAANCGPTITAPAGENGRNKPFVSYGISSYCSNAMKSTNPHSGIYVAETSRTLDHNGGNPACNQGGIAVVQTTAYSIETFHRTTEKEVVAYGVDCRNMNEYPDLYPTLQAKPNGGQSLNFSGALRDQFKVRRLTPTECARLQGFPDKWSHPDAKEDLTDEEYRFWLDVRNTHAALNGKTVKDYTKAQMMKWYNNLHSDSAEYKMWGNGIALPPSLYCLQGMADTLNQEMEVIDA